MWSRPKLVGLVVVVLGAAGAAIAASWLVRPERTNPSVDATRTLQAQPGTTPELVAVLGRACADCHSNATNWSKYPRAGPVSWIVARGVTEGRRVLNFSEWSGYPPDMRRALLVASCTDARNGTMPMRAYVALRPEAQLSAHDVETICAASRQPPPPTASSAGLPARSQP